MPLNYCFGKNFHMNISFRSLLNAFKFQPAENDQRLIIVGWWIWLSTHSQYSKKPPTQPFEIKHKKFMSAERAVSKIGKIFERPINI